MPAEPLHTIFISYSRAHALAQADALCKALAVDSPALSAFKDDTSIEPGQAWLTRLEQALAGCERFVVLVGPEGLQRWVGAEVASILIRCFGADDAQARPQIIPVLMGDTPPSALGGWLSQFQALAWPQDQAEPPPTLLEALKAEHASDAAVPTPFAGRNPFVGLQALQAEHAGLFFGRERDLAQCLTRLGDSHPPRPSVGPALSRPLPQGRYLRWLSIEGGSGSGKSSLLRAGLLPMVRAGALSARSGLNDWVVVGPLLPGDDPLTALCTQLSAALLPEPQRDSLTLRATLQAATKPDALAVWLRDRLSTRPHTGVLLAIDQFEEFFTLCPPAQRQHLDALLAHALSAPVRQVHLVSTCRSDYAHRIVEDLPHLGRLRQEHGSVWAMAPMSLAEMRRAIVGPARLCGLDVSPVIEAVLQDARDDLAGALPLLQQCLYGLYEDAAHSQSPVRQLQWQSYEQRGRLVGAMCQQADALLDALQARSPKHREGALELLLALSHWQPDGRHTRQHLPLVAARRQAGLGHEQRGEEVINALCPHQGGTRVVTVSGEGQALRVDLVHEALLRSRPGTPPTPYWKTLLDYLEQHRDRQHLREGLRLQALAWQQRGAGRKGTASYGDLRRLRPLQPLANELEQRFIQASYWPARLSLLGVAVGALGVLLGAMLAPKLDWEEQSRSLAATPLMVQAMAWLRPTPAPEQSLPQAVEIPLGRFTYGCHVGRDADSCRDDERAMEVDLSTQPGVCTAFAATEVTFDQYDHYVRSVRAIDAQDRDQARPTYPRAAGWGWQQRGQHPVVNVSWHEAVAYAQWLSHTTGQAWRLPTEVEWEWAARAQHSSRPGGQAGRYWWGEESPETKRSPGGKPVANCSECGPGVGTGTTPVAHFAANPFGLYDTVGNVWEWTHSLRTSDNSPQPFAVEPKSDGDADGWRVLRGGAWDYLAAYARASGRYYAPPDYRYVSVGFRVCRASPIETPGTGADER